MQPAAADRLRRQRVLIIVAQHHGRAGEDDFADKVLSALRYEFGGHEEKAAAKKGGS